MLADLQHLLDRHKNQTVQQLLTELATDIGTAPEELRPILRKMLTVQLSIFTRSHDYQSNPGHWPAQ